MKNSIVLGCGRSGTSLLAGAIARAGAFVGEDPYPARDANPMGFFESADVNGVMTALGVQQADIVAHDIGNMVAFQFAAQFPGRVRRLVLIDAPVPGVGPWEEILKNPLLWHFRFGGPDMERLVAGRERVKAQQAARPFPHFEQAPGKSGYLVKIDEDGKRTVGRFVNREFRPAGRK